MKAIPATTRLLQRSIRGTLKENKKLYSKNVPTRQFEEIKINVPWGYIAGKWYGPKHTRPIVGVHGWQDNAGTFDTLAPLLPSHVGFLSIDLPGHGLSSWLPHGCNYHSLDYVSILNTLMSEFNWSKISLLAHSMSSINGFVFCSLFPEKCDMLIGIDAMKPLIRTPEIFIDSIAKRLEGFQKVDERNRTNVEPPCYEYDQLVERMYEGTGKSIEKENCRYMIKRNTKPSIHEPHKFYFSRDNRLKTTIFYTLSQEVVLEMATRIKCPHMFIKALGAGYFEEKKYFDEALSVLLQKPTFEFHEVEGTHHVHLNEPHKIASIVNPFIYKHRPE